MTTKSQLQIDDSHLYISEVTWYDLIGGQSTIPLRGVLAAASEMVRNGGAFVVVAMDGSIFRRSDSGSELDTLVRDIEAARANVGLPAINP